MAATQWSHRSKSCSGASSTSMLYVCQQGKSLTRLQIWAFAASWCDKYQNLMLTQRQTTKSQSEWRLRSDWSVSTLSLKWVFYELSLCLLINFANSLDPDQADKMSVLIWIQNWHFDCIPERIFQKSWFWKTSVDGKKELRMRLGQLGVFGVFMAPFGWSALL